MKKYLILIILVILSIAIFFGFHKYREVQDLKSRNLLTFIPTGKWNADCDYYIKNWKAYFVWWPFGSPITETLDNININNFKESSIDNCFADDWNNYYFFWKDITWKDIHPIWGKRIKIWDKLYYHSSWGKTEDPFTNLKEIRDADIESYKVVDAEIGKDKTHVYFQNKVIIWADPESFETINPEESYAKYYKDNHYIYIRYSGNDEVIMVDWIDPKYFSLINNMIFKDSNKIYYRNSIKTVAILTWANLETFKAIDSSKWLFWNLAWSIPQYYKDQNNVYYYYHHTFHTLEWADPESFEVITKKCWEGTCLWKDKNNIFYNNIMIEWPEPMLNEFEFRWYIKGKQYVYYNWWKVDWADLQTFKKSLATKHDAEDKNYKYIDGKEMSQYLKERSDYQYEVKVVKDTTKFTLQSNSSFCSKKMEWCWKSMLTITRDTIIYHNNRKTCSWETPDVDWAKLVWWLNLNALSSANILTLCSNCVNNAEMILSISAQGSEYRLDFDSPWRFDFNSKNSSHIPLKELINNINELWDKNKNGNEEMICSLRQ